MGGQQWVRRYCIYIIKLSTYPGSRKIVECRWNEEIPDWQIVCVRVDKSNPNSDSVAISSWILQLCIAAAFEIIFVFLSRADVLRCIDERLAESDVREALERDSPPPLKKQRPD
jgi:hypothetical protein